MNDAIKAVGTDPSFLDTQQKKKEKTVHEIQHSFEMRSIHKGPSNSTPTNLPLSLSFNSDSLDRVEDSPFWLKEKYIKDHHLKEEILDDDFNPCCEYRINFCGKPQFFSFLR
ncbi:unnamed protein product [Rotaria magnacalcarata]|uniref:Uncharacterized protein n=2 Tax=Rotaria magnacalcarata TaxID=392030 RepID=A0A816QI61_9BILA|nr:unnamed protein product [Rotaria magnacalcarata]